MKRVLYIDIPFTGINDGGANRSKFIWKTLVSQYDVDWLELEREGIPSGTENPTGINNHFKLKVKIDRRMFMPIMIFCLPKSSRQQLHNIFRKNKYDLVFIRFLSPARLSKIIKKYCPTIVFDIDMLLSRLSMLSWKRKPQFNNRYYFLESIKQDKYEKSFFKNPYLFLFTNSEERESVLQKMKLSDPNHIKVLPNVMEKKELCSLPKKQRIIFFGTLTSAANADALKYLDEELYELMEKRLEETGIYLDVVGRGWHNHFDQIFNGKNRLRYIGEVADIQEEISSSLAVFLPLRIASGTRTRILEAANQAVPVITTPIGAEGLDLKEEILIRSNSIDLVDGLFLVLKDKTLRQKLGQSLQIKSRQLYGEENVRTLLINLLENYWENRNA